MKFTYSDKTHRLQLTKASGAKFILTPKQTVGLIRYCTDLAHKISEGPSTGPYVVCANLDYSDYGQGGQGTQSYQWGVAVNDADLAQAIVNAATDELALTSFAMESVVDCPSVPEIKFSTNRLQLCRTVAAAITNLRIALFEHQSNSVADDSEYWVNLGFTREDADEINLTVGDYRWDSRKKGVFDPIGLLEFVRTNSVAGYEDGLLLRLQRWIAGESIEDLKKHEVTG